VPPDPTACYRALVARDARFDGVFFVGVTTTGIYCRPVCHAKTPREDRCVFFRDAALAEREGFRACFRCRPERAPGHGTDDAVSRTVREAASRIEAGALEDGGVDALARGLGVTSRHLRRCMQTELGVSPIELATSRRLAVARELLHGTTLPVTRIAFASGFASLRRFNDAFARHHGVPPSRLRARVPARATEAVRLELGYRPPLDWTALLAFLERRAVRGVEAVMDGAYVRAVRAGTRRGWLVVRPGQGHALSLEVSPSLLHDLVPLVAKVRRLFDLDAHPGVIDRHLSRDARLAPLVRRHPGLRVPGAFEPAETAMQAVLGQQVTVRAGVTLASRLVEAFGEAVEAPFEGVSRVWPTMNDLARRAPEAIASLGIPMARARSILGLARAIADGTVDFARPSEADLDATLRALEGVGPWTAEYIRMRCASWPDAFPSADVALAKALGTKPRDVTPGFAEAWRPWRSYATLHLWTSL
jgi:AraC family transcriptional regulator of adaptative response / DNA-3-methyladenine glycosylase II